MKIFNCTMNLSATIGILVLLTACDTQVDVNSASGSTVSLDGEWKSDCAAGDTRRAIAFTGHHANVRINVYDEEYPSKDGTCTGTPTRTKDDDYSMFFFDSGVTADNDGEKEVLGWTNTADDETPVPAPDSLAGPPLQDTPVVTQLKMSDSLFFTELRWIVYVDDTDADNGNYKLYFAEDRGFVGLVDYPDYLVVSNAYTKTQ